MHTEERLTEWLERIRRTERAVSEPGCQLRSPHPGEAPDQFLRRSEISVRKEVDLLLIEWIDTGALPPIPPGDARFWLRARLSHALWLEKLLSAPQDQHQFFHLDDEQGRLDADTLCWMLFDSWVFAGFDFWIYVTTEVLHLTHFDFGAE